MTVTEEDDVYDEYDELLYLDLKGVVQSEITKEALKSFKLLGVHKPNPILQIGGLVFQGAVEPTLGTAVFFQEQDPSVRAFLPTHVFSKKPEKMLEFSCKAKNMVHMKRIFVKKKHEDASDGGSAENGADNLN